MALASLLVSCGDIVTLTCCVLAGFGMQYPLSDLVKEEAGDDRVKGVAVIVSINKQRNDAWTLPEDILDRAELQVRRYSTMHLFIYVANCMPRCLLNLHDRFPVEPGQFATPVLGLDYAPICVIMIVSCVPLYS